MFLSRFSLKQIYALSWTIYNLKNTTPDTQKNCGALTDSPRPQVRPRCQPGPAEPRYSHGGQVIGTGAGAESVELEADGGICTLDISCGTNLLKLYCLPGIDLSIYRTRSKPHPGPRNIVSVFRSQAEQILRSSKLCAGKWGGVQPYWK